MDDNEIRLKASFDTGQFQGEVAAAEEAVKGFAASVGGIAPNAEKAEAATNRFSSSLGQASARLGAVSLGAGQFGYALSIVARALPELSGLLAAAFPVIGAVALVEVVGQMIDKFTKIEEGVRKAQHSFQSLGFDAIRLANELQLTNLKLEDSIAKLEGLPSQNGLAIGQLEAKLAIDKTIAALDHLLEKSQETAKSAEVAWLSVAHFVGGVEPTTLEEGLIAPLRQALMEKLALQRIANESGNAEQKRAADQEVETARHAAEEEAKFLVHNIELRQQQQKEYAATHIFSTPDDLGPLLAKAKAELAQFTSIGAAEAAARRQAADIIKENELRVAEEIRARKYSIQQREIKDTESLGAEVVAREKQQSEDAFRAAQDGMRLLVSQAVEGGQDRVAAELAAIPTLRAAQATRTQAELREQQESYANRRKALEDQLELDRALGSPKDRTKAVEHDNVEIAKLEDENQKSIEHIKAAGRSAQAALDVKASEESVAVARKEASDTADIYRANEALATKVANDELKVIEDKSRSMERDFSLGMASRAQEQASLQTTIRLLEQERDKQLALVRAKIAAEEAAQAPGKEFGPEVAGGDAFRASQQRVATMQEDLNSLQERYNQDITQTQDRFIQLDISTSRFFQRMKNETLLAGVSWKSLAEQFQLSWQSALTKVNADFGNSLGQWILHGGSFVRAMQNMGAELVANLASDFTKMGLVMFETWLKATIQHAVQEHLQAATTAAVQAQMTAAVTAGIAARTAAQTAADIAQVATTAATAVTTAAIDETSATVSKSKYASVAAVKAGSAVADIPIVGPILAPIAAASTYAAMMVFEKGGIVASDTPAFLHSQEMVLPANLSRTVQNIGAANEGRNLTMNSSTNTTGNQIGRLQFQQVINTPDYNPAQHADDMFKEIQKKLQRRGYNI